MESEEHYTYPMIAYIAPLVALVGLLIYLLTTTQTKITEVGRIMFFCGLLVFIAQMANHVVNLVR